MRAIIGPRFRKRTGSVKELLLPSWRTERDPYGSDSPATACESGRDIPNGNIGRNIKVSHRMKFGRCFEIHVAGCGSGKNRVWITGIRARSVFMLGLGWVSIQRRPVRWPNRKMDISGPRRLPDI